MKASVSKNFFWDLISKGVAVIGSFVISRTLLLSYGSDVNGLISSITNLLSVIVISDMGISVAVQVALYGPLARNDEDQISSVMVATANFYRLIGGVLVIYIFILCVVFPRLITEQIGAIFIIQLIIVLGSSSIVQYLFGVSRTMLLNADGKSYVISMVDSFSNLLNVVLCCVFTNRGYSVIVVKIATMGCFMMKPIFYSLYVKKNYRINWNAPAIKIEQKWNGAAQHLLEYINGYADITVLSLFTSLINVSIYTVYNMPLSFCRQFLSVFSISARPVLGNYWALEEKEKYEKFFDLYQFCIHFVGTVVYGTSLVMVVPFVMIYTAKLEDAEGYLANSFAVLITFATYVRFYCMPESDVVNTAGYLKQTQYMFAFAAIVNVLASIVLVIIVGLDGVAWGTLLSAIYLTLHMSWFVYKKILKKSFGIFLRMALKDLLIIVIACFLCKKLLIVDYELLSWITHSFVVVCVFALISLSINYCFDRENMTEVFGIVINKIMRLICRRGK